MNAWFVVSKSCRIDHDNTRGTLPWQRVVEEARADRSVAARPVDSAEWPLDDTVGCPPPWVGFRAVRLRFQGHPSERRVGKPGVRTMRPTEALQRREDTP